MLSKKDLFKSNPTIDPRNGHVITIGSKEYKQLVNKYGEPHKIKSPKTNKLISIGKGTYNQLKTLGYTDDQLIYQHNKLNTANQLYHQPLQYNELNEDIWRLILLESRHIKNSCFINTITSKICQQKSFWIEYFSLHQLPLMYKIEPTTISQWIKTVDAIRYLLNIGFKTKAGKYYDTLWERWEEELLNHLGEDDIIDILNHYIILDPTIVNRYDLIERCTEWYSNFTPLLQFLLTHGLDPNKLIDKIPLLLYLLKKQLENELDENLNHLSKKEWKEIFDDYKKRIKILLQAGSDINAIYNDADLYPIDGIYNVYPSDYTNYNTILHFVVRYNIKNLAFFLQHGADPNVKNSQGETPFLLFCRLTQNKRPNEQQKNKEKYFKLFSQYQADFKAENNQGLSCEKMGYHKYIWG